MTREEAIHRLKNTAWLGSNEDREETEQAIDMAIEALQFVEHFDLLKEFQSLQEVVRCKECKHYSVEGETTRFGWCGYWNKPTDEMRYCSDGERREP